MPETHRLFAVVRERGTAWDHTRPMREQDGWPEHAGFMDALADEGFIAAGGPLGDGDRVLHVVRADDEREIERRLAEDPWGEDMLRLASVEPWTVLLGGL
jgi:uncharacterized protein YciI